VPASQCPSIAPEWQDPAGVPISAFLFGGRRATTVPLVFESRDWRHGVLVAATMGSEQTAAAAGEVGALRTDPFAMLPFCGYNMGDYMAHWLSMTDRTEAASLPTIYGVNWFRKDRETGKFLWPGFGENSRVLEWIFRRLDGDASGADTPIGVVPTPSDLDLDGLDVSPDAVAAALSVDADEWRRELPTLRASFDALGERLPAVLREELGLLEARLRDA
jgi:phosphoenolpyruvate carboxykinase (GTP)